MDFIQYQKFLNNQWGQLEQRIQDDKDFQKAGKAKIQISEEFFFTLDISGLPGLLIITNNIKKIDKDFIPNCKNWNIEVLDNQLVMSLKKKEYNDFFRDIINLILTKINLNKINNEESINFFFTNLSSAKNFFDSDAFPKPLSSEKETGLFGELIILNKFINKKYSEEDTLDYWTGPSQKHDFTTPNILLETKTTKHSGKRIIHTSSNDQISPIFEKPLYLSFVQIEANPTGKTLKMLVDEIIKKFEKKSDFLVNDFYIKLRQSGYYETHKDTYKDKYVFKDCNFYSVSKTFPHIKDLKEPEPIFDLSITYKINLEKCEDFRINEEELINNL
jgi:hypothetical protein